MHSAIQTYYGSTLSSTEDLRTSACCDSSSVPDALKPLLSRIHPEVLARYYGCGLVYPPLLKGARVLDLGCGTGRDVYLLAQLVGPDGAVVGVDMTAEQLATAVAHRDYHAELFGFANVRFLEGKIEQLAELDLEPGFFDVIVSNCVVNLTTNKQAVLEGVRRLLKPGGEFFFADVYADRRVPEPLQHDPVLYGECLSGALYWNDFLRISRAAGFPDPRLLSYRRLTITDAQLSAKLGNLSFYSATYRLFNINSLEDACEDHGQAVIYEGDIPGHAEAFVLDQHHRIETGRVFPVCGNSFRMLRDTRMAPHFTFIGDFSRHFGLFPGCGGAMPFQAEVGAALGGGEQAAAASSCC